MNFDAVPAVPFWALYFLGWFVGAMVVTWLFARWVDSANPRHRRGQWRHMASVDQVRDRSRT
jgi:glycerol uptake facilitator-like aquaporin